MTVRESYSRALEQGSLAPRSRTLLLFADIFLEIWVPNPGFSPLILVFTCLSAAIDARSHLSGMHRYICMFGRISHVVSLSGVPKLEEKYVLR